MYIIRIQLLPLLFYHYCQVVSRGKWSLNYIIASNYKLVILLKCSYNYHIIKECVFWNHLQSGMVSSLLLLDY